jgi:essential nuclear protein 1
MAEMPYSGITSFFIKTLVDKKYSLPYRVVDALVDHFCSFKTDARELPVVWHLSLLAFVQRYKHEIRSEVRSDPSSRLCTTRCGP